MRRILILLALSLTTTSVFGETIRASDAASHSGQSVTVEGVVNEVHTVRSGNATFIDMGGYYPNNTFTAVIFARSMAAVGDVSGLDGKTVDITGTVQTYQGKPEIIVISREQIHVK